MSTPFTDFFPIMRAILGDRQVLGLWNYAEADLTSALRAVFMLGRGPKGYAMNPATSAGTEVTPGVAAGDAFALITYDACHVLVGGEDGALAYKTRSLSVIDRGDRKRDLLFELRNLIGEIRDGAAYFSTYQTLAQYIGALRGAADQGIPFPLTPDFIELKVRSGVSTLTL